MLQTGKRFGVLIRTNVGPGSTLAARRRWNAAANSVESTPHQEEVEGQYHLKHELAKLRDFCSGPWLTELKGYL
jgi:hypothetical protein